MSPARLAGGLDPPWQRTRVGHRLRCTRLAPAPLPHPRPPRRHLATQTGFTDVEPHAAADCHLGAEYLVLICHAHHSRQNAGQRGAPASSPSCCRCTRKARSALSKDPHKGVAAGFCRLGHSHSTCAPMSTSFRQRDRGRWKECACRHAWDGGCIAWPGGCVCCCQAGHA